MTAAATDNLRTQRVGADVTLPGSTATSAAIPTGSAVLTSVLSGDSSAGVVLAVTASVWGSGGNFTVTPFSDAQEWVNGGSSGAFTYSYPIAVPPVPGGFAPAVSLGYDSQLTDGLSSSTNNEASWIGDGWDYSPGFIEQDYPTCGSVGIVSGKPSDLCDTTARAPGDMPPLTLSLNGTLSSIVKDKTTLQLKAEADSGATFSRGANGSWVVTQPDGTTYYFGLGQLPGYASGDAQTGSAWTVPAYSGTAGPSGTPATVTWRWNLDYVTDRHGDAIAYFYNPQANWYAEAGGTTGTGQYTRGGTLAKITYGFQDGHAYDQTPPGELDFTTTGGRTDAPTDLACSQGQACPVVAPTFWNDQQLTTITTKALVGTAQQPVDSWALSQAFPATGDPQTPTPSLWLSSITQTGQDGATPITMPPTSFAANTATMPNRAMTAADITAGYSPITRFRIATITTPTGGQTSIAYTGQDSTCTSSSRTHTPATNTSRCYPDYWDLQASTTPILDWFYLYGVTSRTVTDSTGGDPPVVTSYIDSSPAWHYDADAVYRSVTQTYDQWRGFSSVTTETGTAPDPVTETVDTYFQGMSKDNNSTVVNLTSSRGTTAEDSDGNAGMTFEEITYNGAGTGNEVTDTIHSATTWATTATTNPVGFWPNLKATVVADNAVTTYTALAGGGTRESTTSFVRDKQTGQTLSETDVPDTSDPSESTCTDYTYNSNFQVTEEDVWTPDPRLGCPSPSATPSVSTLQTLAVSATSNTYDPAGNLTQVQKATGITAPGTGSCPASSWFCWNWQTTQASTYDQYGRVLTSTDADNRKTVTAYTPATGAEPTSETVTDPVGLATMTTYDPARDLPLTVTDPAGGQSIKAYDALGRPTSAWTPGNPSSGAAVDTYSYTVSSSGPSYTTQQAEEPGGGYLATITIQDSLGQTREVQQQTASGGSDITDTSYNSDGSKALVSSPYYVSAAPSGTLVAAAPGSVPSQTGYQYDGDGRIVKAIAYKNGTQTWETDTSYGGNYTTVVPPQGGTSQTTFTDGRDLTAAIYQYHAGVPADPSDPAAEYDKTSYTYTPAKKLATITDAAGNQWSYVYDLLGNQLTQATPDSGTTTNTYDAAGQLMSVTDARGKATSYSYDGDGRKTAEYDTTGGALETAADQTASWTYDTLAKGMLTSSTAYVNGDQYTEQVTGYNSQGLPSGDQTVIPSSQGALAGTCTTQYAYAPDGQQTSYTDSAAGGLPGETITTGYDTAGEENSLTGASTYVTGVTYTSLGQPLQDTMGTSSQPVYLTDSYDPQTGSVTEQNTQTGTGQASIDDLHYSYDNYGNVTEEADTPAGAAAAQVQCFQNDYLGRLVQAWAQASATCAATPSASAEGGAAPYWNSYSYDVTGNLTSTTSTTPAGTGTTTTGTYPAPGSPQPHATTSQKTISPSGTTTSSYSYDKSGHLTGIAGGQNQAYTWNDPGQLTQDAVTPSGGTAQDSSYIYDADGTLLLEADPGTTTLYLGDEELSLAAGTVTGTRYYDINGTIIATRTGAASIAYLAGNTQDTDSVGIDAATLNVTRRYYDPYGNQIGTPPASFPAGQKGFVGGTASTATGLTNLGAREYQPGLGTFISTDPILKPTEPQDLNPYAYSQGNPSTLSDPAGTSNEPVGGSPGSPCDKYKVDSQQWYYCTYQYYDPKTGCASDDKKTFNNCEASQKPKGSQHVTCADGHGQIVESGTSCPDIFDTSGSFLDWLKHNWRGVMEAAGMGICAAASAGACVIAGIVVGLAEFASDAHDHGFDGKTFEDLAKNVFTTAAGGMAAKFAADFVKYGGDKEAAKEALSLTKGWWDKPYLNMRDGGFKNAKDAFDATFTAITLSSNAFWAVAGCFAGNSNVCH